MLGKFVPFFDTTPAASGGGVLSNYWIDENPILDDILAITKNIEIKENKQNHYTWYQRQMFVISWLKFVKIWDN